jgi:4,5-DOPA dioxygenase extradiol
MGESYFISHGSPMLAIQDNTYTQELQRLGKSMGKPEAVIVFTAHWTSRELTLTDTDDVYETIYDFGGFPDELFRVKYPARGSKSLSEDIRNLLETAGIQAKPTSARGLDHGVWVILRHLFPDADIPVVAISVNPQLPPEQQYRIGQALAAIRKQRNVLILGSGATVHNFRAMNLRDPDRVDDWAKEFDDWLVEKMKQWDTASLFNYEQLAPHARQATPDYEHFLPLFIAMGSGDMERKAELVHQSYQYGSLSHLVMRF